LKLILLNRHAASRTLELGKMVVGAAVCLFHRRPLGLVSVSYQLVLVTGLILSRPLAFPRSEQQAIERAEALAQMGVEAQSRLTAMTRRLASLQAQVTRSMRLGTHLTELAGLEAGEFDFSGPPALGWTHAAHRAASSLNVAEIDTQFSALDTIFAQREVQFDVLAGLLSAEQLQRRRPLRGDRFARGWQSSPYGSRIDPITGKRAWHDGADFAGREGSDILAVASGVVSWSG
jgi:murein DD-endopeptidase MepM/ murein hydrolase activator NlpD